MKKALIYAILVLILFNSAGYYFLFELNKFVIRVEMQTKIQRNSEKITVIRIHNVQEDKDFHRIDKREFAYRGEMYDIVREIKTGKTTIFLCLHDTRETKLLAGFKQVHHEKVHLAAWNPFTMIFTPPTDIDLDPICSGNLSFPRMEILLKSSVLAIYSPPPKDS